ncbi:sterol desaturase family protein [Xenorhabdus griffiniae]|uniref:sterol desaturase family protein n=1 Tax=Xenorhabdus griffiniae TaxID=351672 RepID=UPI0030CB378B
MMINYFLILWFLFLFIFDIVIYIRKNYGSDIYNRHWKNNFCNFLLTKLISFLFLMPLVIYASTHSLTHMLSHKGAVLSIIIAIIILDLAGYLFHRISHKNQFMWKFHEIHHLDEVLDATTGLRVHFMESIFHTCLNFIIIWILGISMEAILLHSIIGFIIAIFHHSKVTLQIKFEKTLSYLITTPRFHEPHHDKEYENNNTNYSFIFSVWDRFFKTYHKETFKRDWNYGLAYQRDVDMFESIIRPLKKN